MATALQPTAVTCPKCNGPVWDQKMGKFWGNGLRSNGKQKPRWECKNKECGGAVWEEKNVVSATPPKPSPAHANVPNQQLPPLLQNQEAEDAAELQSKIGDGRKEALDAVKAKHAFAMKHANEFVIKHIVPLYEAVEIGLTGDDCYKQAYTIFQTWEDKGLIE